MRRIFFKLHKYSRCSNHCKANDKEYYGLAGDKGKKCFCANVDPNEKLAKKEDSECEVVPCPGDLQEKCGAQKMMKLHKIQKVDNGNLSPECLLHLYLYCFPAN